MSFVVLYLICLQRRPYGKYKVLPGDNAGEVSDFSEKPGDIRPIKSGSTVFENRADFFFRSAGWWTTIVLLIIVLLAVAYTFRKRAKENGDFLRNKRKNANKVATIRLQKANQLMLQGNAGEFFDEVLRALWGYIGDRLNMEAEQLNREHVATKLHELHIDGDTIRRFIGAIDECEFERYAPGDAKGQHEPHHRGGHDGHHTDRERYGTESERSQDAGLQDAAGRHALPDGAALSGRHQADGRQGIHTGQLPPGGQGLQRPAASPRALAELKVLDISLVGRPTFLAECVGQLAKEVRPLMVARNIISNSWY